MIRIYTGKDPQKMSDKRWAQTYSDIMLRLDIERNMMLSALREVAQDVFNAIEQGRQQ